MVNKDLFLEVENLISSDETKKALIILKDLDLESMKEDVIILLSNYNFLQKKLNLGVIEHNQFMLTQNKINIATLRLLSELKAAKSKELKISANEEGLIKRVIKKDNHLEGSINLLSIGDNLSKPNLLNLILGPKYPPFIFENHIPITLTPDIFIRQSKKVKIKVYDGHHFGIIDFPDYEKRRVDKNIKLFKEEMSEFDCLLYFANVRDILISSKMKMVFKHLQNELDKAVLSKTIIIADYQGTLPENFTEKEEMDLKLRINSGLKENLVGDELNIPIFFIRKPESVEETKKVLGKVFSTLEDEKANLFHNVID